jgi:carboxyl-terminal processing protease
MCFKNKKKTKSFLLLLIFALLITLNLESKLPDIHPADVTRKANEIMSAHACYKELSPLLAQRILQNYIENLDPNKVYFIEGDIKQWISPSNELLTALINDYRLHQFQIFEQIHDKMFSAISRRHELEEKINLQNLPKHVKAEEFKKLEWAVSNDELVNRISKLKSLQIDLTSKLKTEDLKEKGLQRIAKKQAKFEEEILSKNPTQKERFILANVLKATAEALDSNTAYFTPGEASQFVINLQLKLFGIGVQLRDDLNGFTAVKIVEGGPAAKGKELKAKDRIIAIDGEPVAGMDITEAVELIRGKENTPVTLTVVRMTAEEGITKEEQLDIVIKRGEVVLKDTRYESSYEPFGEGVIGYLRLYSFYQDRDTSSTEDLRQEIEKLKEEHKLLGIILDLRYNAGGLLTEAVGVTGLFITKGIVVSVKDDSGQLQHLRNTDNGIAWNGPLMVLVNRASASASEIVAQTLQDYGRAIVAGDSHSWGKGSFQTFTLNSDDGSSVNPQGEYKVTRGRYYTVSGKTPQLTGVTSDIVVPGAVSAMEIGEKFSKYPLENDFIKPNFQDDLSDIPFMHREKFRRLYKFDLQSKVETYTPHMTTLKINSENRIADNKNYQNFLQELRKNEDFDEEESMGFGSTDLQLTEAYSIMKDLIYLRK